MGKEEGYINLQKGRGWNKGRGKKSICCVCGRLFPRSPSHFKSKNSFCSIECKAQGMKLKLCKPMRLGTGCDSITAYYKRKYYRYATLDRGNKVYSIDYSVWDLVNRLKNGECYYCGSKDDLGLDKIDNNKGHTIDNTVISCELCNMTRGARFSVEEMLMIGKIIKVIKNNREKGCDANEYGAVLQK